MTKWYTDPNGDLASLTGGMSEDGYVLLDEGVAELLGAFVQAVLSDVDSGPWAIVLTRLLDIAGDLEAYRIWGDPKGNEV